MILYPETRYLPQPKSAHLLKPKSKRMHFPVISPRERALLLRAPPSYKPQSRSFADKGETSQRGQSDNLQKLKELFEKIIKKDSADPAQPLPTMPTIPKSPLRNKSIESQNKTSVNVVLTASKRFQVAKPPLTRKKEKTSKPIFSLNTLTVISRSFSKKSFGQSFNFGKEKNEQVARNDRRLKTRILQREREKEYWLELQKDDGVAGLILNGNSRVSASSRIGLIGSARNAGLVGAGVARRDFGFFFRSGDAGRGQAGLVSESDEDRIEVCEDFLYV